ncbi:unnamed protein product [Pedinophyceae sp. YPF-701]|nr:unnamed protein product [Pedinophyceae sp. YPF-701]
MNFNRPLDDIVRDRRGGRRDGRGGRGGGWHGQRRWGSDRGYGGRGSQHRSSIEDSPEFRRIHDEDRKKALDMLHDRLFELPRAEVPSASVELFTAPAFAVPDMMDLKKRLNETKDKLDTKDISVWGKHTTFTNRAGDVVRRLRQSVAPEMCTIAWAKMYEMIHACGLLTEEAVGRARADPARQAVATVHLCEAPGAFIAATNHYVRTKLPRWEWDWRGLTLNPYFEGNDRGAMIDDDALIKETMQHWCWGADNSGDVREPENIRALWKEAQGMFSKLGVAGATMVTADGSIDCQENPNEQEATTAPLHYCEMVCGLGMLAPGGSLVLKAFTLFEHPSVCLMYMLSSLFDTCLVHKPATSKPGNSEVYVIGRGFRGIEPALLERLLSFVSKDPGMFKNVSLLPEASIPESYMRQAVACAGKFSGAQRDIIEENLELDTFMSHPTRESRYKVKRWFAEHFREWYRIMPLDKSMHLARTRLTGTNNNTNKSLGGRGRDKPGGTLEERRAHYKRRRDDLYGETTEDGSATVSVEERPRKRHMGSGMDVYVDEQFQDPRGDDAGMGLPESNKGMQMLMGMGYKQGQGLGRKNDGIRQPLLDHSQQSRMGLGFGLDNRAAPATRSFAPVPDSRAHVRDGRVSLGGSWAIDAARPVAIIASKFLPDDVLRSLKSKREALSSKGLQCKHATPCCAPRSGNGVASRSYWKLAAASRTLKILETMSLGGMLDDGTDDVCVDLSASKAGVAQFLCDASQANAQPLHVLTTASAAVQHCPAGKVTCVGPHPEAAVSDGHGVSSAVQVTIASVEEQLKARRVTGAALVVGDLSSLKSLVKSSPPVVPGSLNIELSLRYRRQLVAEALVGLKVLQTSGSLVLRLGDCLTRFSAGVLYLLHSCFSSFVIMRPFTSCVVSLGERIAVFSGRNSSVKDCIERLSTLLAKMEECERSGEELVSNPVPPQEYIGTEFFSYIFSRNVALAEAEASMLGNLLREGAAEEGAALDHAVAREQVGVRA